MGVEWTERASLAARTRYRIGGPAARLAVIEDVPALRAALEALDGAPFRTLGHGANTLVSDDGLGEAVLVLGTGFKELTVGEDWIEMGAALPIPSLVQAARRHGRAGWERLEAVPGTIGGALSMNAGSRAWGIWEAVEWAEAFVPGEREPVRLSAEEVEPGYRHTRLPAGTVLVRARVRAEAGDPGEVERTHLEFRARKVAEQPYDRPTCGSIWTNPPGHSVWQMVDAVGMRGRRVGDAQVSELHANFIVNLGEARAADVVALMRETRRRIAEEFGIELWPEVRLWGFGPELLAELGARDESTGAPPR